MERPYSVVAKVLKMNNKLVSVPPSVQASRAFWTLNRPRSENDKKINGLEGVDAWTLRPPSYGGGSSLRLPPSEEGLGASS